MRNKVLMIEEMSANAFPAILTEVYDGWILRYSKGYTYRGNSIIPLYNSTLDLYQKIKVCENKFFQKGLPCVFKMTECSDSGLDSLLQSRQYTVQKKTHIMEASITNMQNLNLDKVAIDYYANDKWLDDFVVLNGTPREPVKSTIKTLIKSIGNPVFCASIYQDKIMVACGLGVLENGYIGLFDIRVHEQFRRQGLGTMICQKIIQEGYKKGAHSAYLQVEQTNDIAINMYEKIGFKRLYTYWYRLKSSSDAVISD